jgi:hypothetical protein
MPNWCENDLTVEGPKDVVEEFLRFAEGESTLDFDRFIPYPEAFRRRDEIADAWDREHAERLGADWASRPGDGFNSGGYGWRVANWGTKWRAALVHREEPEAGSAEGTVAVVFHFDTAWSPPLPVVRKAAELFPSLSFELRYFECGDGFNGMFCCSRGEVDFDESGPYFGTRGG